MKNEKETKQLIEEIAEIYGFQKEKIRNPVLLLRGRKIFCVYGKNSSLIRNRYV